MLLNALPVAVALSWFQEAPQRDDGSPAKPVGGPTGALELRLVGDGWKWFGEKQSLTVWIHSDVPEIAAQIPKEISESGIRTRFHEGKGRIESIPVGVDIDVFDNGLNGYTQGKASGPVKAGETAHLDLVWNQWPDELMPRLRSDRLVTGRVVDEKGDAIDARMLAAWIFHPIAEGLARWYPQGSWNWDTKEDLHGTATGEFRFHLGAIHGRPDPGVLVLGVRDPEHGMTRIARIPLTPATDIAGADFKDVPCARAELIVAGSVINDAGKPVKGAMVWVEPDGFARDAGQFGYTMTSPRGCIRGLSDAKGDFSLHGITETTSLKVFARMPEEMKEGKSDIGRRTSLSLKQPQPTLAKPGEKSARVRLSE
jgi:hypothetical protein